MKVEMILAVEQWKVDHITEELPLVFSNISVRSFTSSSIWPMKEGWRRQGQTA